MKTKTCLIENKSETCKKLKTDFLKLKLLILNFHFPETPSNYKVLTT